MAEPAPAPAAALDEVEQRVLAVVAEQTGYPTELLDMDLDLEADLGIDTVKQAEVFASIREQYGIERDDSLKLRDYPTISHVVGFVRERAPQQAAPAAEPTPAAEPAPEPAAEPAPEPAARQAAPIADADAEGFPRRIPIAVLRPALEHCVPTGIDLAQGHRVILMPDAGGVAPALVKLLTDRGVEVLSIDGSPTVDAVERQIAGWTASGPVHGVYWLPALDDEGPLDALDAKARRAALHIRVRLLAATLRALADHVGPHGTFLISGTRLGGRHGYDAAGAPSVFGGAVAGFTKALSQERRDATVKVIDFASSADPGETAAKLIEETLSDPGAVEVGYADQLRWSVSLTVTPAEHDPTREPDDGSVFLITGAAGSIVAAITADLAAAAHGGTFHLLDLVPEPDRSDPDLETISKRPPEAAARARRQDPGAGRPTDAEADRARARTDRAGTCRARCDRGD